MSILSEQYYKPYNQGDLFEAIQDVLGSKRTLLTESVKKIALHGGEDPTKKTDMLEVNHHEKMVDITEKETGLKWSITQDKAAEIAGKLSEALVKDKTITITISNSKTDLYIQTNPVEFIVGEKTIPLNSKAIIAHDSEYNGLIGGYCMNKDQLELFIKVLAPYMGDDVVA